MQKNFLISLILFCSASIQAQSTGNSETSRFGVIGSFDLAYNFQDKVLNAGLGRKWSVGISFTNKKRQFVGFVAGGFKGFKINLYSPTFRESFINNVKQNYIPINGTNEDSLIGAKMNSNPKEALWGTYSQYLEVGFILNRKLRPSVSLCAGREEFLLHDDSYRKYEDPAHGDINYVGMETMFYELKIGCTVPLKIFMDQPFCLNLNIGYKWVDYGTFKFNNTPLSAYTTGSLKDKYNSCGKITVSICFIYWSNWSIRKKIRKKD